MIKKIDHVVITTSNIEKCLSFYEKLGFIRGNKKDRYELFAGDFKINIHIKGEELLPHAKKVNVGTQDLCFEITNNIEEFMDELLKKEIDIESGVVTRDGTRGIMQSIYIRDYDGNIIEFCSYML